MSKKCQNSYDDALIDSIANAKKEVEKSFMEIDKVKVKRKNELLDQLEHIENEYTIYKDYDLKMLEKIRSSAESTLTQNRQQAMMLQIENLLCQLVSDKEEELKVVLFQCDLKNVEDFFTKFGKISIEESEKEYIDMSTLTPSIKPSISRANSQSLRESKAQKLITQQSNQNKQETIAEKEKFRQNLGSVLEKSITNRPPLVAEKPYDNYKSRRIPVKPQKSVSKENFSEIAQDREEAKYTFVRSIPNRQEMVKEMNEISSKLTRNTANPNISSRHSSIKPPVPSKEQLYSDINKEEMLKLNKYNTAPGSVYNTIRLTPYVSTCNFGEGIKQLKNPKGIMVHECKSEIYIADAGNNCVKVFNTNGQFKRTLGDKKGAKMSYPYSICMLLDTIYVSQFNEGKIYAYNINGDFISQVGGKGSKPGLFNHIWGIAACEDYGEIYACDYMNNRVQVFDSKLNFIAIRIGEKDLNRPKDVKIKKKLIYVLHSIWPCIQTFNLYGESLAKLINFNQYLQDPMFFTIDINDDIFISDPVMNTVCVFSSEEDYSYKLGEVTNPAGVAAFNRANIAVVTNDEKSMLKIY